MGHMRRRPYYTTGRCKNLLYTSLLSTRSEMPFSLENLPQGAPSKNPSKNLLQSLLKTSFYETFLEVLSGPLNRDL